MSDSDGLKGLDFRAYLFGIGSGHLAAGLQVTLFPWLIVGVLHESPDRIGVAQMAVLLPNLFFILWGGVLSDARHLGSHLFRLYSLYTLPLLVLLVAILSHQLSYWIVLIFGTTYGVITAFVQPARESLLAQAATQSLQGAVSRATFVQFVASSVGILLAGSMDHIAVEILLIVQVLLFLTAGYFFRRSNNGPRQVVASGTPWRNVASGLQLVWARKRLLHLMILVASTGFLGMGAYLVVIPLLARDVYQQDASFFATLQFCFTFGVIVANLLFMRFHYLLRWPGRMMLFSQMARGLLLMLISLHLPPWLLFVVIWFWGLFSGVSMVLGRVMTHSESPNEYRSRVVSIYQLCFFGAAPLGAWVGGEFIGAVGVLQTLIILGGAMFSFSLLSAVFSGLWYIRNEPQLKV